MAISHSQKVVILDALNSNVATQKSVVLLTTNKAEVSLDSELTFKIRRDARSKGIAIKVVKNTLIQKAFESAPKLIGPTYLAYLVDGSNSDEIGVPKSMVELVTADFKDNFSILGSVVNGEFLDTATTIQLSKTLTKEQSLAKIAGLMNSFAAKIALTVKEVPASTARGISAYSKTLN
jgi:large subunit ribosomal protein L10